MFYMVKDSRGRLARNIPWIADRLHGGPRHVTCQFCPTWSYYNASNHACTTASGI